MTIGIYKDTLAAFLGMEDTLWDDNYAELDAPETVLRQWYEHIGSPEGTFENWYHNEYTMDENDGFVDFCESIGALDDVEIVLF